MPTFNFVVDPKTKEKISLFGQSGGEILSNYVKIYKKIRADKNKTRTKTKDEVKNETE